MKALLRYGDFTHFIDIPERWPEVRVIEPAGKLTVHDVEYGDVTSTDPLHRVLVFDFSKMLDKDIPEYVFTGKV